MSNPIGKFWASSNSLSSNEDQLSIGSQTTEDWDNPLDTENPNNIQEVPQPAFGKLSLSNRSISSPQTPPKGTHTISHQTPSPVKESIDFLLKKNTSTPLKSSQQSPLKRVFAYLNNQSIDTPTKQQRAEKVRKIGNEFIAAWSETPAQKLPEGLDTLEFHSNLSHKLLNSTWASTLLKELHNIYTNSEYQDQKFFMSSVINLNHIYNPQFTEENKSTGFHFCPPHHEMYPKLKSIVKNPITQVFSASWRHEKADPNEENKFSTFFPHSINTEKQLLELLRRAEPIADTQNRKLFLDPQTNITIEAMIRKDFGIEIIYSAFPVFFFEKYNKETSYQITENVIKNPSEILTTALYIMETEITSDRKHKIRFITEQDYIILDLASLLNVGVEKGIYFSFLKEIFETIEGFSDFWRNCATKFSRDPLKEIL